MEIGNFDSDRQNNTNMNKEDINFCAIDFELLNKGFTSACKVGMVQVKNGAIAQKYYTLLRPVTHEVGHVQSDMNGITYEDVKDAPSWAEIYPIFDRFAESGCIAYHNKGVEPHVLDELARHFGIAQKKYKEIDTMCIYGGQTSLVKACEAEGVTIEHHHDPLADATAVAEIILKREGVDVSTPSTMKKSEMRDARKHGHTQVQAKHKERLEEHDVIYRGSVFYNKHVVRTGTFESFPNRSDLDEVLCECGAAVQNGLSSKTDILIVGTDAGPSKIKKANELLAKGSLKQIMSEQELMQELKKYNIKY